jgi:hypothetical protein
VRLFSARPPLRKLPAMDDKEILKRAGAKDAEDLDDRLAGVLQHRLVCLFRYRRRSPTAGDLPRLIPDRRARSVDRRSKRVPPPETSGRLAAGPGDAGKSAQRDSTPAPFASLRPTRNTTRTTASSERPR